MDQFMIGADVVELRGLATQFDACAEALTRLSATVTGAVRGSAWAGPSANRFRASWSAEHSVRLRAVALELHGQATVLRSQAAEQEAASSVGSPVGVRPVLGLDSGDLRRLVEVQGGATWESFQAFIAAMDAEVPGFSSLSPSDMIHTALNMGDLVGRKVPYLGGLMDAGESLDLIGRTIAGRASVVEWTDQVGGLMMSPAAPPVVKLVGLNVQVWKMVGEEAAKVDFSAGATASTLDYMVSNPGETAAEFGKAAAGVGAKVFNMLKF